MKEKTLVEILTEFKINKSEFCKRAGLSRASIFAITRDSAPSIHTARAIHVVFTEMTGEDLSCWDYINKRKIKK